MRGRPGSAERETASSWHFHRNRPLYLRLRVDSRGQVPGDVKFTDYFQTIRTRPDRAAIKDEWLERAIANPIREAIQGDGRIRRWARIPEMNNRYLRVILLKDGETVHNAFFDRGFAP